MTRTPISRRTALRGLGVSLALPWLEAMGPATAWAAGADTKSPAPNRMCFLYVPNGKNMADWTPKAEGTDFDLPPILEPLKPVRDQAAGAHRADRGQGPAARRRRRRPRPRAGRVPHRRAAARRPTAPTSGPASRSIRWPRRGSADKTRLPSLELGGEHGSMAGNCDSGYSCVYSSTMSWRSATQPLPKEVNPKLVFERLFATKPPAERAAAGRDAARACSTSSARTRKDLDDQARGERQAEAGRVLLRRARHRAADRARREAAAGEDARLQGARRASRRSTTNTSA